MTDQNISLEVLEVRGDGTEIIPIDFTDSVTITYREDAELLTVDILADDRLEPPQRIVTYPPSGNWYLNYWDDKLPENLFQCTYKRTTNEQLLYEKATFFESEESGVVVGKIWYKLWKEVVDNAQFDFANDEDGVVESFVGGDFQAIIAWILRAEPATAIRLAVKLSDNKPSANDLSIIKSSHALAEILSESMSGVKDWRGAVAVFNEYFLGVRINDAGDDFEFVDMFKVPDNPPQFEDFENIIWKNTAIDLDNIVIQQDYYYADIETAKVTKTEFRSPPSDTYDRKTDKEVSSEARATVECILQRNHIAKSTRRVNITIPVDFSIRPYDVIAVKNKHSSDYSNYVVLQATTTITGESKPVTNIVAFLQSPYKY